MFLGLCLLATTTSDHLHIVEAICTVNNTVIGCLLVAIHTAMVSAFNANDAKIILLERFQEITVILQDVKIIHRPLMFFTSYVPVVNSSNGKGP